MHTYLKGAFQSI